MRGGDTMSNDYIAMPAIGEVVTLVAADEEGLPVEVIDATGLRMTLLPTPGVDAAEPAPDTELVLRWADHNGRYGAPVRMRKPMLGRRRPGWLVEAVGTVDVDEGRRSARVMAAGPVQIGPDHTEIGPLRRANLVDISESGLRCRMPSGTDLEVGMAARIKLTLADAVLDLTAKTVRLAPVPGATGVEIAVQFIGLTGEQVSLLRTFVLRRRSRERELSSDGPG
jgi:hypothetical protein